MQTLGDIKRSSAEIDNSLEESKRLRLKLLEDYEQYKPLCERAANLFVGVSAIYHLNENRFINIFEKCIGKVSGNHIELSSINRFDH